MNNKSQNGESSDGRDKEIVIGMRDGCEIPIKGGDGSDGKGWCSTPPRNLMATDSGLPTRNPRIQIKPGGLALAC